MTRALRRVGLMVLVAVIVCLATWAFGAATDLPPLPAKVGVQEKASPPAPAPVDNSLTARQNRVLACMAREHLQVRPADIAWVTRGNTAQALTGLEWVDTTVQGGQ